MKNPIEHQREVKAAADSLAEFNRLACIQFAKALRTHDEYKWVSAKLGLPAPDVIPVAWFEASYKILSYGTVADRAQLILGTRDQTRKLITRVLNMGGFSDERGFWIEL